MSSHEQHPESPSSKKAATHKKTWTPQQEAHHDADGKEQKQEEEVKALKNIDRMTAQDLLLKSLRVNLLSMVSPIALVANICYDLYHADILNSKQREEIQKNYNQLNDQWSEIKNNYQNWGFTKTVKELSSYVKNATAFFTTDMAQFIKKNPDILFNTAKEVIKSLNPIFSFVGQTLSRMFDKEVGPVKVFQELHQDFKNLEKNFKNLFGFKVEEPEQEPKTKP